MKRGLHCHIYMLTVNIDGFCESQATFSWHEAHCEPPTDVHRIH